MARIETLDDLRVWFRNKPADVAVPIASRCAMRVLPLVVSLAGNTSSASGEYNRLCSATLRTHIILRSVKFHSNREVISNATVHAANAALAAIDATACDTSATAAIAIIAKATLASANSYVDAAISASDALGNIVAECGHAHHQEGYSRAYESHRAFLEALNLDCNWAETGTPASIDAIQYAALWPGETPELIASHFSAFRRQDSWKIWAYWYQRRISGCFSEWGLTLEGEREMARRLIKADEEAFWKRGEADPAFINQAIADWMKELKACEPDFDEIIAAQESGHSPPFGSPEETKAREAVVGHSTELERALAVLRHGRGGIGGNCPPPEFRIDPRSNAVIEAVADANAAIKAEISKTEPDAIVIAQKAKFLQQCAHWLAGKADKCAEEFVKKFGGTLGTAAALTVSGVSIGAVLVALGGLLYDVAHWLHIVFFGG